MNTEEWVLTLRHRYRWAVDSIVIKRRNWRYRSDSPYQVPDESEIRFLAWMRCELRRLQEGRVMPYRRLFHG